MKIIVMRSLQILFALEVIIFLTLYIVGKNGMVSLWALEKEHIVTSEHLCQLQKRIRYLEHQCVSWEDTPFFKEKIAREQLQMARPGETVYYITHKKHDKQV